MDNVVRARVQGTVHKLSRGTMTIGDTLFIDGVPHIKCGVCGAVAKKFDGTYQTSSTKQNTQREIKPYTVQKLMGFKTTQQYVWVRDQQELRITQVPILKSVPACKVCWLKR